MSNGRIRIDVAGSVQGVGFRPYAHALASGLGLAGYVCNDSLGVSIEVEGRDACLREFVERLQASPPATARIERVTIEEMAPTGCGDFRILDSAERGDRRAYAPVDGAVCAACLRELRDPNNRRYRHPFINCTDCGPRYTLITDLPYDRERTTMAPFSMCPACRQEYGEPGNRRFHAEATCCPDCGPRLRLVNACGEPACDGDPVEAAVALLQGGAILAIKGIGGYHLACDATNAEAVTRLRERKQRDFKAFAIMTRDASVADRLCHVSHEERSVLEGRERPIVLLRRRPGTPIVEAVAPRNPALGVMLPYAPLHVLLLDGPCDALVMTSGNLSDEPIAHRDDDAFARLGQVADAFVTHDREIHVRTDDSVVRVAATKARFLRRSRGYAPFPVGLPGDAAAGSVLATGAELGATVCLTREGQAFLSHHLGDLDHLGAYESFLGAVAHLRRLLGVAPDVVACDLHPGYRTTRYAMESGVPVFQVQHHHAHVAAVLAESGVNRKVIGVVFDGAGWGDDGTLWGGEFLVCDLAACQRAGHLRGVPQPGGDAAAKRPDRMAYAYLRERPYGGAATLARDLLPSVGERERSLLDGMLAGGVNSPNTSSMGRLFDAASALLGICCANTYHAQAPMELEAQAWQAEHEDGYYAASVERGQEGTLLVCGADILWEMAQDRLNGASVPACAARFHNAVVAMSHGICRTLREQSGLSTVALAGGVFANAFLLERLAARLSGDGFEVLVNARVPSGDGGISLGQAAVAAWRR